MPLSLRRPIPSNRSTMLYIRATKPGLVLEDCADRFGRSTHRTMMSKSKDAALKSRNWGRYDPMGRSGEISASPVGFRSANYSMGAIAPPVRVNRLAMLACKTCR